MIHDFVLSNALALFLGGLMLACCVGVLEGFVHGKDDAGRLSYKKFLFKALSPILFYSVVGGGGLYVAINV